MTENYFYHRFISFRRLLFDDCDHNIPRHCEIPTDHNVFDHHSNVSITYYPSDDTSSTSISNVLLNNDNTTLICNSDENGNFSRSIVDVSDSHYGSHSLENITMLESSKENIFQRKEEKVELSVKYVSFQYQIQTSVIQTSSKLNDENGTLFMIEKRMSDFLVAYIFGDGDRCFGLQRKNNETTTRSPISIDTIVDFNGHRRLLRTLEQNEQQHFQSNVISNSSQESYDNTNDSLETIIGISALPNDEILPGLEGGKFLLLEIFLKDTFHQRCDT